MSKNGRFIWKALQEYHLIGDLILKNILTSLPIATQHQLRDLGIVKYVNDFGAILFASGLVVIHPSIIYKAFKAWRSTKCIELPGKRLQLETSTLISSPSGIETGQALITNLVLFVHGGAWGGGKLWQYRLQAHGIAKLLKADQVALLKYPYYPDATILQQRDFVLEAVHFIHSDLFRRHLGFSSAQTIRVTFVGHSSGANIGALALIDTLIQQSLYKNPPFYSFIGLSGPYDLVKHYEREYERGVHEISPMKGGAGGYDRLWECSPNILMDKIFVEGKRRLSSDLQQPKVALLHGIEDEVVPVHSSQVFEESLRQAGLTNVQGFYYNASHLSTMLDYRIAQLIKIDNCYMECYFFRVDLDGVKKREIHNIANSQTLELVVKVVKM